MVFFIRGVDMAAIVAFILTLLRAIPAARDIFLKVEEIYIAERLDSVDRTTAEHKKDLEYLIALKQKAIKERNDEEVTRTHRLYIRFLSKL